MTDVPAPSNDSVWKRYTTLFELPPDLGPLPVEVTRLDNQVLVRYHETDWRTYETRGS